MWVSITMLAAVSVVLFVMAFITKNYALLFGLFFLFMAWQTYSSMKDWVATTSKIEFEIENSNLIITGESFKNETAIDSIKKMVLQTRKNRIVSIILYPESGAPEKVEGIHNIESFADEIKTIIGGEKVKCSRFFHR